jgi:hypothetical protein
MPSGYLLAGRFRLGPAVAPGGKNPGQRPFATPIAEQEVQTPADSSLAEAAIRVQGRRALRQGGFGARHHCAVRVISAADSPSVNNAARASDYLFLGHYNNFFLRCDDDFFLWCDHDFLRRLRDGPTHFHCALATDASGMPDPFGAFHSNGSAGSSSHEHGSRQGYHKTLHFRSPIDQVAGN